MKRTMLSTLASLLAIAAFGQGFVVFQNASTIAGWSPVADRNVKFGVAAASYNPLLVPGANVSSNYAGVNLGSLRAALLYSTEAVSDANWFMMVTNLASAQTGSPYATFKQSTSTTAGSWYGGGRTMAGVPVASGLASLMVFVWDTAYSDDPVSPAVFNGLWGRSAVIQYYTPPTGPPFLWMMHDLASFEIGTLETPPTVGPWAVPEPGLIAHGFLGAALCLVFRRKKP